MTNALPYKIFALATLASLCASSVYAGDLPRRQRAQLQPFTPPPPVISWTGFYAGVNLGATFGGTSGVGVIQGASQGASQNNPTNTDRMFATVGSGYTSTSQNAGVIGGGQIGYNYQFWDQYLIGVEADIQGIGKSKDIGSSAGSANSTTGYSSLYFTNLTSTNANSNTTVARTLDWLGTVRGRVGYLIVPKLLIFASGGLAYGYGEARMANSQTIGSDSITNYVSELGYVLTRNTLAGGYTYFRKYSTAYNGGSGPYGAGGGSRGDTMVGWSVGGGVEYEFMKNMTGKIEYLYYDLGSLQFTGANVASSNSSTYLVSQTRTKFDGHIVRVGLNYHFDMSSPTLPIVASY